MGLYGVIKEESGILLLCSREEGTSEANEVLEVEGDQVPFYMIRCFLAAPLKMIRDCTRISNAVARVARSSSMVEAA